MLKENDCENWRTREKGENAQTFCADQLIKEGKERAKRLESYIGTHVGKNHQCVSLVLEEFPEIGPSTINWASGGKVQDMKNFEVGTQAIPIAIFQSNGIYGNTSGESHAAIMVGKDDNGIWVYDQWNNNTDKKKGAIALRYYKFSDIKYPKNATKYNAIKRK